MEGEVAGNCLRCGAPYGPDDTVCYTCGAPIGETRANTQPVKAVRPTQRPATSSETATATSAPPAPRLTAPPRLTVGSGSVLSPTAPEPPASKRGGRLRGVVVVVLCLVLVAVVGGAVAALHQITTPPPVAHQTTYSDPQGRFAFTRPALWKVAETPTGVTLTDSTSVSTASVTVENATLGTTAQTAASAHASARGLATAPSRSIAGEVWEVRSGQVTGQDGVLREYVLLVAIHGGSVYTIEFVCPIASYDATNRLVYQPLIDSFRFNS